MGLHEPMGHLFRTIQVTKDLL